MKNLRALVVEKLEANKSQRETMLAVIALGETIAFVGAGLSAPLKYPDWLKLLAALDQRANQLAIFSPSAATKLDVLQYAEEIWNHFRANGATQEFNSIIGREFAPRAGGLNCTSTHHRLAKLPFRAFVTTNYDMCLEQALGGPDPGIIIKASGADRHRVSLFLRSMTETIDHQRYVGHIHGRHDDTDNIILTLSAYVNAYGFPLNKIRPDPSRPVTLHRQLAWSLFATRRMIFFGCSMEDPYIKVLLDTVAADLWEWGVTTHFVVLPIDEKTVESIDIMSAQFQRFGLQPVFFDNLSDNFSNLDQLIDEAIERCPNVQLNAPDSTVKPAIVQSPPPSPSNPNLTFGKRLIAGMLKLFGRAKVKDVAQPPVFKVEQQFDVGPDWLEELNRVAEKSLKKDEN